MAPTVSKNILVTRIVLCIAAAVSFGVGVRFFCEWYFFPGIPPKAALKFAEGRVEWSQGKRYEIRFRLAGVPQLLVYSRPSGNIGLVVSAISSQTRPTISVLFNVAPQRLHRRRRGVEATLSFPSVAKCFLIAGWRFATVCSNARGYAT